MTHSESFWRGAEACAWALVFIWASAVLARRQWRLRGTRFALRAQVRARLQYQVNLQSSVHSTLHEPGTVDNATNSNEPSANHIFNVNNRPNQNSASGGSKLRATRCRCRWRWPLSLQVSLLTSVAMLAIFKTWASFTNGVCPEAWLCGNHSRQTGSSAGILAEEVFQLEDRNWNLEHDMLKPQTYMSHSSNVDTSLKESYGLSKNTDENQLASSSSTLLSVDHQFTNRSRAICVPVLEPRRWEVTLDAGYMLTSALMLIHLVRSSVQLRARPSVRLGLIYCATLAALCCAVLTLSVPIEELANDGALLSTVHFLLAIESATLSLVLLWTYYSLWQASLSVPIHMALLRNMTRRITILALALILGWVTFGVSQLWLAMTRQKLMVDSLGIEASMLFAVVAQVAPTCAMLNFHSRVPVVARRRAGRVSPVAPPSHFDISSMLSETIISPPAAATRSPLLSNENRSTIQSPDLLLTTTEASLEDADSLSRPLL
mmetsp:Transcript_10251/g.20083  ORF Transcript_10251/g.20083 Transcript_10251/m.20083 type:complete len:491 (+) Transcript_10251:148-1620(+)